MRRCFVLHTLFGLSLVACGGDDIAFLSYATGGAAAGPSSMGQSGGSSSLGGAFTTGGITGAGGQSSAIGGVVGTATGGVTAVGGQQPTGGQPSTGGSGSPPTVGTETGGSPPTVGTETGGSPPTVGPATGGSPPTVGPATGGSPPTDGPATGGSPPTDGPATGGTATGGTATGGTPPTDGPATGGTATGGTATGGTATGGTAQGGTLNNLPRFVGNITTGNSVSPNGLEYSTYWDQITPENAGKWGSVQSSGSSGFNWGTLDAIYDYAQSHNILFKQHVFVWGSQQPSGVTSQDQVINWIRSFCERYPDTALIDVVNEPPPHTEPAYANVIGGGTNGDWAWITNTFKWAREYCGDAILILNDYNNIEWTNDNQHFIDIVNTIKANGAPIDAVGAQAHDLDHQSANSGTIQNLLNKLHDDTGLPVYITEMDLSYSDDQQQLSAYETYFPMFWDASFVHGITIWGWIYGSTWSLAPDSGLVRNGSSRSAMTYLMNQLGRPSP